jgi:hypothetical protein
MHGSRGSRSLVTAPVDLISALATTVQDRRAQDLIGEAEGQGLRNDAAFQHGTAS